MGDEKFVQGVRDVIRYYDYKFAEPIEMKNLFEVLTSDNDNDKVPMQDGTKENILPTKNFRITIDPAQVLSTKTVSESMKDSIAATMDWTYNKNYVTKTELAMFDILAHNDWKRPVYFAVTVPSSNYIGLDKYLYNEGFAYRLLPLKQAATDSTTQEPELINADRMYDNMLNKFVWGNMKGAKYLDPETTRMIATIIKSFNTLAGKLYEEGRIEEAKKVLNKSLEVVPEKNYLFYYILHRYYTADLLYKVGETQKANQLVKHTSKFISDELSYVGGLSGSRQRFAMNDIQLGVSVLNELLKITEANKQTALHTELQKQFTNLQGSLSLNYE